MDPSSLGLVRSWFRQTFRFWRLNDSRTYKPERLRVLCALASVPSVLMSCPFLNKDRLGNHHVHTLIPIDEFGDVEIGGDAGKHEGIIAREVFFGHQEIDHLAHGERRRSIQIVI